jgi:hypothetical protein
MTGEGLSKVSVVFKLKQFYPRLTYLRRIMRILVKMEDQVIILMLDRMKVS